MATITISDALHSKLCELAWNASLQDNRATASPFFYQIKETVEICGIDSEFDWDVEKLRSSDGDTCDVDRDSMILELQLLGEDIDFTLRKDDDLRTMLVDTYDYTPVYIRKTDKYTGAFLTEKSCKEHIELNKHHYHHPVDFLQYARRNPDMEIIAQLLKELVAFSEPNGIPSFVRGQALHEMEIPI